MSKLKDEIDRINREYAYSSQALRDALIANAKTYLKEEGVEVTAKEKAAASEAARQSEIARITTQIMVARPQTPYEQARTEAMAINFKAEKAAGVWDLPSTPEVPEASGLEGLTLAELREQVIGKALSPEEVAEADRKSVQDAYDAQQNEYVTRKAREKAAAAETLSKQRESIAAQAAWESENGVS